MLKLNKILSVLMILIFMVFRLSSSVYANVIDYDSFENEDLDSILDYDSFENEDLITGEELKAAINKTGEEIMNIRKTENKISSNEVSSNSIGISTCEIPTEIWTKTSSTAVSSVYIGGTSFGKTIPAATSTTNTKLYSSSISFTITQSKIKNISGINVTSGYTSSESYSYQGPGYNDKLSDGRAANYAYVVGVSRFRVYKYVYRVTSITGAFLRNETIYAPVTAGNSTYLLRVNEGAVSIYIENANRNKTKYYSSRDAYINALTNSSTTPAYNVNNCIVFK